MPFQHYHTQPGLDGPGHSLGTSGGSDNEHISDLARLP